MEKLLITKRGEIEDLYTFGTVVVVNSEGKVIYSKGNPTEIAFSRSSEKLMQGLIPLMLKGDVVYNLSDKEISTICSSHSGESFHIDTVSNILKKIGLDESYLKCGAHYPFKMDIELEMKKHSIEPKQIHNNCSGKHAGMLMSTKLLGATIEDYYELGHPVQEKIRETVSLICDFDIKDKYIAIDGCGVPVHATPIYNFAYGMARMTDEKTLPIEIYENAEKIIRSITKYPAYTSGSDRIDYNIIRKYPGKIIVKSGANGFFGGLLPKEKLGFGIKVYDGGSEKRNIILIALLKKLGIIEESDYEFFNDLADTSIKNHRGEVVGEIISKL